MAEQPRLTRSRTWLRVSLPVTLLFPLKTDTAAGASFEIPGPPFHVRVSFVPDEHRGAGYFSEHPRGLAEGDVLVTDKVLAEFKRWPDYGLEFAARLEARTFGDGERITSPFLLLSEGAQVQASAIFSRLVTAARAAAGVICWVHDHPVPLFPLSTAPCEWSEDGTSWQHLPQHYYVRVSDAALQWSGPNTAALVQEILNAGLSEPLAYVLLGEAIEMKDRSPRGAFIMLSTALEVGTKRALELLVPDTTWLLDNLQAPPVLKLLEDYLPGLPDRGAPGTTNLAPARAAQGAQELIAEGRQPAQQTDPPRRSDHRRRHVG